MTKPKTRVRITLQGWKCLRCGHEWVARKKGVPKRCGGCKSTLWDRPRRFPQKRAKKHGPVPEDD